MSLSSISAEKLAAYQATHYRFRAGGQATVLRIGVKCPEPARLLDETKTKSALFITALNPHGQAQADSDNAAAHHKLLRELSRRTSHIYPGEGADPEGLWAPETSVLVLGLSRADAQNLGELFLQDAVLWASEDAVPRLLLLR